MMHEAGPFTIRELILNGNQDPDHNALESPGCQPLTYRDLRQQLLYVVKTLNAMGFHRNDRIAIITPAGPETAVIIISVMAGFTSVPLNPQNKKQEYERYFSQLKIQAVIVQQGATTNAVGVAQEHRIPIITLIPVPGKAGRFTLEPNVSWERQEPEFATPSDISHVFMTSGTTSRAKIVPITQRQSVFAQQRNCGVLKLTPADRCLHIVPYYHGMGIGPPLLSVLIAGGTVICTREFIPSDFLHLLKTYRPTYYSAGPAIHQGILREIRKVSPAELKGNTLRFIRSGSAALPSRVRTELETLLGVPMIEAFAMSEAGVVSVNFPSREGSVGMPVIENLRIIDENAQPLGPLQQGEIIVKGETVFSGYEDAPEENRTAFIDGWFRTGDLGYLDREGYLFYTGRKKELINKGGEKISPAEIDAVFMTHPSVKQAMAFRIDDPVLGEDVAAMVVLENPDVGEEELRTYLIDRLIQFKVPKRIYIVDEIPKGPTGKLLRYVGTEQYKDGKFEEGVHSQPASDAVSPELSRNQEKILQTWKDVLVKEDLSPDDDFFRSGGNSLAAIELLIKIQRAFQLSFPPDTIYRYPTIRQQAVLVTGKSGTVAPYHPLIVPIRKNGRKIPVFCIHEIGGWIGQYQTIAPFLDQDRPVFGIRARGLETSEKPFLTVEEAVREYSDAIKTVQQEGPYNLMGFSAGAVYAFELACQFQKRGEGIRYLGIIDASAPSPQRKLFNLTKGLGSNSFLATGHRLYLFMRNRLKTDHGTILYPLFVKVVSVLSRGLLYLKDANLISVSDQESDIIIGDERDEWILKTFPPEQQPLVRTLRRALSDYKPGIFSGDITFFTTGLDSEFFPGDTMRGWSAFITGTTCVIEVPGDHQTLFSEPHGRVIARKINESLKGVE